MSQEDLVAAVTLQTSIGYFCCKLSAKPSFERLRLSSIVINGHGHYKHVKTGSSINERDFASINLYKSSVRAQPDRRSDLALLEGALS